jgi:hypothetical protein
MKKTLEVGDVLYNDSCGIFRIVIERVTKTQAISGNTRVKREYDYSTKEVGASVWTTRWWYIETEELKQKHRRSKILYKVQKARFTDLSTDKLEAIVRIINGENK